MFKLEEFEIDDDEVRRLTVLMDFDDSLPRTKQPSIENLLETDNVRISLASISSRYSEDSRYSTGMRSSRAENFDYDNFGINVLTMEALNHYKQYHNKNFRQSQIEEKVYEPGIFVTSERIVRILAKLLHIGHEPDRVSTFYQPIIFYCSSKTPFLLELFSRTMWLLSKTRREMKASTFHDYEKVINVLEKQIKIVLEQRPMDFKQLTAKMVATTYETVMELWQKEKEGEMNYAIATNPSVQVLKKRFITQNEQLIFEQRMNYLHNGAVFPKFNEKKTHGYFVAKLSSNRRELIIYDFDPKTESSGEAKIYTISNITHVIEGRACPHVKNKIVNDFEQHLAFSIIINNEEYINFKAKDRKMASYWVDAFNLLLAKENRSEAYKNELEQLVKMDLVLHLLELQNVTIPMKPPPVPPTPFEVRPPIPPKPQILK